MSRPHTPRTGAEQVQDAAYFDTLSEREIRRRQDLCTAQMKRAFDARDDDAMARLQEMEAALTAAMLRRC